MGTSTLVNGSPEPGKVKVVRQRSGIHLSYTVAGKSWFSDSNQLPDTAIGYGTIFNFLIQRRVNAVSRTSIGNSNVLIHVSSLHSPHWILAVVCSVRERDVHMSVWDGHQKEQGGDSKRLEWRRGRVLWWWWKIETNGESLVRMCWSRCDRRHHSGPDLSRRVYLSLPWHTHSL